MSRLLCIYIRPSNTSSAPPTLPFILYSSFSSILGNTPGLDTAQPVPKPIISLAMNFHLGTKNVRLQNGHYLIASISVDGNWEDATLDLDLYIGNNNGSLSWGGCSEYPCLTEEMRYANMSNPHPDFSQRATEIRIGKDARAGWCPILEATLLDSQGVAHISGLYLGRCIGVWKSTLICGMIGTQHSMHLTLTEVGRCRYQQSTLGGACVEHSRRLSLL